MNVLAKEKLNEERLVFIKHEEEMIRRSKQELCIQQHRERDRIAKTLGKLRNADFQDKNTKHFVKDAVPDIDVSELFKPKKPEKKEGEDM